MTPELASSSALRMVVGLQAVSLIITREHETLALKSWLLPGTENDFQAVEPELRAIFGAEQLLSLPFKSKICALACSDATLVPRRLFVPDQLDHYFKLLLREGVERKYGYEKIDAFDCYLIWAADARLTQLCGQYFSPDQISHLAAPLLKTYHRLAPSEGVAVFANLRGQKIQLTIFERGDLVFFNTFYFSKPSDLLYFVLLTYKQFELNPLEIPLTLSGNVLEDSEIYKLLFRYIRTMRFAALPEGFKLPDHAKNLQPHFWFDLSTI